MSLPVGELVCVGVAVCDALGVPERDADGLGVEEDDGVFEVLARIEIEVVEVPLFDGELDAVGVIEFVGVPEDVADAVVELVSEPEGEGV